MFDWRSDELHAVVVSRYFWIYWAVAAPLTAFVLLIWRIWWTVEEKRYQAELLEAKQDLKMPTNYTEQEEAIARARAKLGHREWANLGVPFWGSF